jgi:peptidoglycan/xylan/chitin deacetylase (PgdA/CDA1 family)
MKGIRILSALGITVALAIATALCLSAPWYVYVIVVFTAISVMIYGSASVCSGFYIDVICSGNKSGEKIIAVTFDDGPDKSVTPAILDILHKHNVKAAFFCVGRKILKAPIW